MVEGKHPFIEHGLADWLASVPMGATEDIAIPIDQGKSVPLNLLVEAMEIRVGSILGSFTIPPELADSFTQFTEDPTRRNLFAEPTSVERVEDDIWKVSVGGYEGPFSREELWRRIRETLEHTSEGKP